MLRQNLCAPPISEVVLLQEEAARAAARAREAYALYSEHNERCASGGEASGATLSDTPEPSSFWTKLWAAAPAVVAVGLVVGTLKYAGRH